MNFIIEMPTLPSYSEGKMFVVGGTYAGAALPPYKVQEYAIEVFNDNRQAYMHSILEQGVDIVAQDLQHLQSDQKDAIKVGMKMLASAISAAAGRTRVGASAFQFRNLYEVPVVHNANTKRWVVSLYSGYGAGRKLLKTSRVMPDLAEALRACAVWNSKLKNANLNAEVETVNIGSPSVPLVRKSIEYQTSMDHLETIHKWLVGIVETGGVLTHWRARRMLSVIRNLLQVETQCEPVCFVAENNGGHVALGREAVQASPDINAQPVMELTTPSLDDAI